MIQTLGHLFFAVSSIINLNQITATEHQSSEKHSLKTSDKYSTNGNEEKSCTIHDESIITKINRLGPFGFKIQLRVDNPEGFYANLLFCLFFVSEWQNRPCHWGNLMYFVTNYTVFQRITFQNVKLCIPKYRSCKRPWKIR